MSVSYQLSLYTESSAVRGEKFFYGRDTPAAAVSAVKDSSLTHASMLLEFSRADADFLVQILAARHFSHRFAHTCIDAARHFSRRCIDASACTEGTQTPIVGLRLVS